MSRIAIPGDIDVAAAWDGPKKPDLACVLAHGAGGSVDDPVLASVGRYLADAGIGCLRFNFPYREAGRRVPDRHDRCERAILAAAAAVAAAASAAGAKRVVLGGKSFGGRMASQLVARGDANPPALVFLGYPLHPPGKPDRLRTEHLSAIGCPMLFVSGTRDPFARPDLLEAALAVLRSATLLSVEGGDHSLRVRATPTAETLAKVGEAVAAWLHDHA